MSTSVVSVSNRAQRILMGVLSGAGSVVLKTVLNFVLIPLMIFHLGIEPFALYVLLINTLEIALTLDSGFSTAIVKLLGHYREQDETSHESEQVLKTAQVVYQLMALLAVASSFVLIPWFPQAFHIGAALQPVVTICLFLVLVETALTIYSDYFRAVLMTHCQHQWVNAGDTLFYLMGNGLGILVLALGFGLPHLMMVRLFAAVVRAFLLALKCLDVEKSVLFPKAGFSFYHLKELGNLCFYVSLVNISVIVSHKIQNFIIAAFLPLSAVSIYEIVFRFLSVVQLITVKSSEVAFPLFARLCVNLSLPEKLTEAKKLFLRSSSLNNFVACHLMLIIVFFYHELFTAFSAGKIPMDATLPILALAVPCVWSGCLQVTAGYFLFSSGRQKYLTITSLVAALANLVISVVLVQHIGLAGVVLGCLIAQVFQHQYCLIRQTCLGLQIRFTEYMRTVHGAMVIPFMGALLVLYGLHPLLALFKHQIIGVGMIGSITVLGSFILWFSLTGTPQEKSFFVLKLVTPLRSKLIPGARISHG